ncbi:hypothetical protein KKB69_01070, partial [Patescibacteria group bacterium]|nr:hypothetical protein [Patescibacteria group bacterium]
ECKDVGKINPMPELIFNKEQPPELRFAEVAPEVWQALHELKRTGWVKKIQKLEQDFEEVEIN